MVVKIGIEIELATSETSETRALLYGELNGKWESVHDGSIRCSHNAKKSNAHESICSDCYELGIRQHEYRTTHSKPYTVNLDDVKETVEKIASDYKKILSTLKHTSDNESCGIHIHFSGIKKFGVFYSKEFFDMVHEKYKLFATTPQEQKRLTQYYCQWVYDNSSDRYRAINVLGAFQKHKTFEFRFLPSTANLTTFKRYVRFVLEILRQVKETDYPTKVFNVPLGSIENDQKEIIIQA